MSLSLQNISKRYENRWILRDTSFEAKRGEITGLIGENAVGKTTLLRIIAGRELPNSGKVFFDGADFSTLSAKERSFTLFGKTEEPAWKSIFKSAKTFEISDGQKQKFEIENAVETAQKVLLLDTPFSGMNYELRDEVYQNLKAKIREKNIVCLVATNNLESAFTVCDNVAILQNGEIIQTGAPREIYEKPVSAMAARSLGRINLIRVKRITFNNEPTQEFLTLDGNHQILTDKTEKKSLGAINAPVFLAVRPEHISISFGASFPEDNLIKAKITDIRYQGSTTLLKLNANGLMLESIVLRLVGLNIGDDCMVGIPPDRILVLKD